MGPGPSGWGLDVELTTPHRKKKLPVRKPEMWPRKGLMKRMQAMQGTGRSDQGIERYGANARIGL